MLEVLSPGYLSTIQDAGRPGHGHLGVSRAGAADPLAHAVANVLAGNPESAATLEMTLEGARLAVRSDCVVAIAGADMDATVPEERLHLKPGSSVRLRRGTTLAFGPATDGARTYLALHGGIRAEVVLGSASTDPVAGFGGLSDGPIRAGSLLQPASAERAPDAMRSWPLGVAASGITDLPGPRSVALLPGPHLACLADGTAAALERTTWAVSARSDRVGARLDGPPIDGADALELVSLPMLPGAVQLPPGGRPIVLMPDAPSVGGYPVVAVVASVDRPVLGQLRPGDELRFSWIDMETAQTWARDARARFLAAAGSL